MDLANRVGKAVRKISTHLGLVPRRCTSTMLDGSKLELYPSSDVHELHLYLERQYEPGTLSLFDKSLRPGDTMVDVGANLGLMTLRAARNVGNEGASWRSSLTRSSTRG
jgi:hypothetical protein